MKFLSALKELVITFVLAVLIAIILKFFIIDSCKILSESMASTLNTNDRIIVFKLAYSFEEPERGDIIIFEPPAEMDEGADFIKRIIGLPGETVEVRAGEGVYINGEFLEEPYIEEIPNYDFGPVTVPENSYIVFGDNRNRSADSHYWSYPYITFDDIDGKAILRYFPFNDMTLFRSVDY
ncbi:MAG: signal peptidase I [Clostridia bacterium]